MKPRGRPTIYEGKDDHGYFWGIRNGQNEPLKRKFYFPANNAKAENLAMQLAMTYAEGYHAGQSEQVETA